MRDLKEVLAENRDKYIEQLKNLVAIDTHDLGHGIDGGLEKEGQDYAKYIIDYCTERSIFPLVELYQNQESFFEQIQKTVPAVVLLALPGVSGLNAAEHLRSLYPGCGVIWCSDLDFSLHAFRLRVEYFFMEPVDEQKIREGFSVWLKHSKAM